MNQQPDLNQQPLPLNDLPVSNEDEIKGGQTREHILLARPVGVPSATAVGGDWDGNGSTTIGDYIPR